MNRLLTPSGTVRDLGLLLGRLILGVVLVAHGWQKFSEWGLSGTGDAFSGMGVPAAGFSAVVAAVVELVGGALLLVGLFTPVVAVIVALQMVAAAIIVHVGNGVFVDAGGWELVGVIAAAAVLLAAVGAGRFSLDALLLRRSAGRTAPAVAERDRVAA